MRTGEMLLVVRSLAADIGRAEHKDLWHYNAALEKMMEELGSRSNCEACANCYVSKKAGTSEIIDDVKRFSHIACHLPK